MNYLREAFVWMADPSRWSGPQAIPTRVIEHVGYTALGVVLAAVIAIPAGLWIGHTGRGSKIAPLVTGAARALPTLGLITLFGLILGVGLMGPTLAFMILAIPSLLAGAYSALESVDRATIDAARAQGMTELQILTRVEIPIGAPLLVTGIRSATLQVLATVMLAAYVGNGGLGRYIFLGLATRDYAQMLAGSILVIALALAIDVLLLIVQRACQPRGFSTSAG